MIAQQQQSQPQQQTTFQSASLYVGDLHPDVTEGTLFEMFNRVGPVASIRVCRDAVTRRSLGYAYVNFHNVQDAERSLDTMNFTDIKGRPCRIMWSQRDPSLRKSGVGNVFVKNLAPTVDNKGLFDTFSVFGNILSCKVAMDENGNSKGYGYVHYETAEAAQDAIQKFNGNFIDDMEVTVGPFVRRQERAANVNWTNLYVKQFPLTWDEAKLKEVFGAFGTISNAFIMRDGDGKSKGFGFVNFTEHEMAEAALKELANKTFPDPDVGEGVTFELYVNKAQKRVERVREIKNKMEALKEDRVSKFQGMNLYVKNIDDSVTDEYFREVFSKYGTITSARIMRDLADQTSKGFGFVCFSTAEEAARAQAELNNKLVRAKPITVTLHQRKELRRAQLAATYAPRGPRGYPQGGPASIPMPYVPMYMPQPGQPNTYPPQQPRPFGYQQQFPRGAGVSGSGSLRGVPFAGGRGPAQTSYYPVQNQQQGQFLPNQPPVTGAQNSYQSKRAIPGAQNIPQQVGAQSTPIQPIVNANVALQQRPRQQMNVPASVAAGGRGIPSANPRPTTGYINTVSGMPPVQAHGGIKFDGGARVPQPGMVLPGQPTASSMPVLGEPLDDMALAQADPQMQKNMIGEKLYPLIYVSQPNLAGKITGMLLEMDNAELLNLIESPEALTSKIEEALLVLKTHQSFHGAAGGAQPEDQ